MYYQDYDFRAVQTPDLVLYLGLRALVWNLNVGKSFKHGCGTKNK